MAYTLNAGLTGSVEGTDTRWQRLIDNHAEVQDIYAPPIVDMPVNITSTSTTSQDRLAFVIRRNKAAHTIRFVLRAGATTGSGAIGCYVGASSGTASVSGATTTYTVDVAGSEDATVTIRMRVASVGHSITLYAMQVYILTDGTEQEWVSVGTRWYSGTDQAVPGRVLSDMMSGPALLAQDRMALFAYHLADIQGTIAGKTQAFWGIDNTTVIHPVGRLWIPRHDRAARTCHINAYGTATGSVTYRVTVGPQVWEWTATGHQSTTMELGPGPHDVIAYVTPTASTNGAIRTLQIWRGDY
jgi:hypothetical protein